MTDRGYKIVFMGTPEFAVPSLEALHNADVDIRAVVTVPDKPAGRGLKPRQSPVKRAAEKLNLPVLQPQNLKSPDFLAALDEIQADLYVVVAFRILPTEIFNRTKEGTINLHASLLPEYRGAAPINRVIMDGERKTGVTTFFIQKKVDTGHILLQDEMDIGENETAGELHDRMKFTGANLLVETVKGLQAGTLQSKPQPDDSGKLAPKITKEDCMIRWENPAREIHNQIRGLSPVPGAWCYMDAKRLKVLRSRIADIKEPNQSPGNMKISKDSKLPVVSTGDGNLLELLEVQLEGKRKTSGEAFAHGLHEEGVTLKSPNQNNPG